jgi:hypothetical protein
LVLLCASVSLWLVFLRLIGTIYPPTTGRTPRPRAHPDASAGESAAVGCDMQRHVLLRPHAGANRKPEATERD